MYILLCVRASLPLHLSQNAQVKATGYNHKSFDTPTTYSDSKTCTVINTEKILQMWLLQTVSYKTSNVVRKWTFRGKRVHN